MAAVRAHVLFSFTWMALQWLFRPVFFATKYFFTQSFLAWTNTETLSPGLTAITATYHSSELRVHVNSWLCSSAIAAAIN